MLQEKEATMGLAKKVFACCLAIALLPTFALSAYAAGEKDDPYVGGKPGGYGSADASSIILHKFDVTAFEEGKAAELIAGGELGSGGTVTYTPGTNPTGADLGTSAVIGTYVTTDNATPTDVTLSEMTALSDITFHLEEVDLLPAADPGSSDPDDYTPKSQGIDDYSKTNASGMISWTNLPNGHYRITEPANDTGSPIGPNSYIVSVPMIDPANPAQTINTVHLYPKNKTTAGPVIVKEKPSADDYNGNVVSWTIKAEIPTTLKSTMGQQKYEIVDTMSDGLFYKGNVNVYYLNSTQPVALSAGTDYELTATAGGSSMKVTLLAGGFTKLGDALTASEIDVENGKHILYVTYDTVVDLTEQEFEQAVTPKNEVDLEFVNNDGHTYTDDPPVVIIDSFAGLKIFKLDGSDKKTLLADATFKIFTALKAGGTEVDEASVLKDATGAELEFTTDSNGEFFYGGLDAGEYYIVEGTPPAHYKKVEGFTPVTISQADADGMKTIEAKIYNYRDNTFSLPETGGMGTAIFVGLGVTLIASAGVIFFVSRKRSRNDEQ